MTELNRNNKKISFKTVVLLTLGGILGFIFLGIFAVNALKNKSNNSTNTQTVQSTQQQENTSNEINVNQNDIRNNNLPNTPSGDINNYMVDKDTLSNQESLSKQMEAISAQQQAILGQVNSGNNNIQLQLQKMNSDMILLDQRITNIENAIKPNQPMSGKKTEKGYMWVKERQFQGKGKQLNNTLINATSNGRFWLAGSHSGSFAVGEKINKHTVMQIDDVKNKVYVN